MTEVTGHVIDPAGDARRALHAAVAEHGPGALSNAVVMDAICQDRLRDLPGEAILIGSAARIDVPALLQDRIPKMGNYGAIQSVAATLSEAHGLDNAACLWVVREFARALGLIASGSANPTARTGSGSAGGTGPGTAPPPEADVAAAAMAGEGAVAGGVAGAGMPSGEGAGSTGARSAGTAGEGTWSGAASGGGPASGPVGSRSAGGAAAVGTGPAGAGGLPPQRPPSKPRLLTRNTVGVAAAIALVAGYLGVAAVAHLSPFPAKTVAATSSPPASQGGHSSPTGTPHTSPTGTPHSSPPSNDQILLSKIPRDIQGANNCRKANLSYGATAVSQCMGIPGLTGQVIQYFLYPDSAALSNGYSNFKKTVQFQKTGECGTNGNFTHFIANCESTFTHTSPNITGTIAEYPGQIAGHPSTDQKPVIVTTDNQQNVMVVMIGTNGSDLLAYWNRFQWVVP